jgi:hypothetical protein
MKKSQKEKFRKDLTEFAKSYERKPNVIDAMARHYENQTISEGRIYISNNPNWKE